MIEERIAAEYGKSPQEMRCPIHLSLGQEAAAVALCYNLTERDYMVSTHRGHAHYLAKGGSLNGLICELYGKKTGCSGGQGGSMHLIDRSVGFYGSTSIVAGTIPIGVGLAFAKRIRRAPGIVVICLGDAALEEGVFHEALNFAKLKELPIVFACEDNQYSCFTHKDVRQSFDIKELCRSYKVQFHEWDQRSGKPALTYKWMRYPVFIKMNTWRQVEHCGPNNDDHLGYRNWEAVKNWKYIYEEQFKYLKTGAWLGEINNEIDRAFEFAKKAPFPNEKDIGKYLYASNT